MWLFKRCRVSNQFGFFFSSRRRHTRSKRDWSSDVCSSDLFEEGQILARNGSAANVPAWEKGRKDVYRLRPGGSVTLTMQFREFFGMFMEHCHNTVHEDHAMLVRWELDRGLVPMPTPIPTPQGVGYIASTTLPTAFNQPSNVSNKGGTNGGSG